MPPRAHTASLSHVRLGRVARGTCLLGFLLLLAVPGTVRAQPSSSACTSVPLSPGGRFESIGHAGASVGVLDSAALAPFAGRTLSEALTARIPGVSVMRSSGVAGTGSRIRLRGPSGILIPQEPLLFIDGIRVDGELQSISVDAGGQAASRLDDIAVEDIECVYVFRGPATTARYGTDAAGGVIHLITRQAESGRTRVNAFIEGGTTLDPGDYPANVGNGNFCTRSRAAQGQCTPTSIRSWSPLAAVSPFRTAPRAVAAARTTLAPSPSLSFGVSGGAAIDDGALRRNNHRRYTAGATGTFRPDSTFRVRSDVWFARNQSSLPQVGNNQLSILNGGLLGSSIDDPVRRGYRFVPLSVLEEFGTDQSSRRVGAVARVDWQPRMWLAFTALAGREDSRTRDEQFDPSFQVSQLPRVDPPLFKLLAERRIQQTSARVAASADFGPAFARFTTEVSADYLTQTQRRSTRGFDVTGGPTETSTWSGRDPATKGLIVRQAVNSSDRRFLDVGIRRDVLDRNTFELENPTYPFASATWDLGREFSLAARGVVSALRLRGAYGESGDARPYDAALALAITGGSLGEPSSSPVERTRETEGGIDLGLLGGRIGIEATHFSKRTSDALFQGAIPPGAGGGFSLITPAASWRNRGVELLARARMVDAAAWKADLAVTYTTLDNEVTSLGRNAPLVGTYYRITPGYPLFGTWAREFTVVDANNDGVIVPAEISLGESDRFLGSPVPTRELGLAPSLILPRRVTVAALIDYRGGFRSINLTGRLRCNSVCADLFAPNVPLMNQARAVDPSRAVGGWIEDAAFVRLRELSVGWKLPDGWARSWGAHSSSVLLAGRNLFTHTNYTGLDPEVAFEGQATIDQEELFTLPVPRTFSLRFDVSW